MKSERASLLSSHWFDLSFRRNLTLKVVSLLFIGFAVNGGYSGIVLADTFDESLKTAQVEQKPILAVFGAQWCSWCRKLEAELTKTDAKRLQDKWVIAKIDVDENPELGERFQVSALPALRVLRTDQSLVSGREGFLTIDKLEEWLEPILLDADPKVQRVLYEDGPLSEQDIEQLIKFLGDRSVSVRNAAEERVVKAVRDTDTAIVDVLRTGGLAQQLAAVSILRRWNAPVADIDPWDPESLDETKIAPLLEWLREQEAPQADGTKDNSVPENRLFTDEEMQEAVTRLIRADDASTGESLATVVKMGSPVLSGLRLRLSAPEALSDGERERLREAMFLILAGAKTRLERGSLLTAMAKLDAETHRQAAIELMKHVNSQDQPLVDQLSSDSDPLVRESAVGQLERIGAMKDPNRLKRLLSDPSPSVRTAALRTVSENPRAPLVDTLIEYLGTESDEDLLVYATKTLGQLTGSDQAEEALLSLAVNQAWRVRAAALDAVKEKLEKTSSNMLYGGSGLGRESKISERLASAVLDRTRDEDDFVAEKATQLIPRIITKDSAPEVATFLLEFPERVKSLGADLNEYEKEQIFQPLINFLAESWIVNDNSSKVRLAAELLESFDKDKIKEQIRTLLESPDQQTRIIGARVFVSLVRSERDEKLQSAEDVMTGTTGYRRVGQKSYNPWHPAPESFQKIPKPPVGTQDESADLNQPLAEVSSGVSLFGQSDSEPANESDLGPPQSPDVGALDLLDDLFGSEPILKEESQDDPAKASLAVEGTQTPGAESLSEENASEVVEAADLDAVMDLFGEPAETPQASFSDIASVFNVKPKQTGQAIDSRSGWLAMWQQADTKRPRWMDGCREIFITRCAELAAQNEAGDVQGDAVTELRWMQIARLACGDLEEMNLLIEPLIASQSSVVGASTGPAAPSLFEVWPWLPTSVRTELIHAVEIDWSEATLESHKSQLESLTDIDHIELASWLFAGFETCAGKGSLDVAVASRLLRRALQGLAPSGSDRYVYPSALMKSETAFRNVRNNSVQSPEFESSLKWLDDQYSAATDMRLRAILLVVLQHYQYDRACESAVGIVSEATEDNALLDTALAIALSDYTEASADRAVQFLGHPLQKVQRTAIDRLVVTGQAYVSQHSENGLQVFYDYDEMMPTYWYVNRLLPTEYWEKFLADTAADKHHHAVLLAFALGGNEFDLGDKTEIEGFSSQDIAVAFAKAGRNDKTALDVYRKAMESTEQPTVLYRALRRVSGDQVRQLRSEIREKHGSSVFD